MGGFGGDGFNVEGPCFSRPAVEGFVGERGHPVVAHGRPFGLIFRHGGQRGLWDESLSDSRVDLIDGNFLEDFKLFGLEEGFGEKLNGAFLVLEVAVERPACAVESVLLSSF